MMDVQKGLKSALLALAVIVAIPAPMAYAETTTEVKNDQQPVKQDANVQKQEPMPIDFVIAFVKQHPVALGATALFWLIIHKRATTKPNAEYHMSDFKDDVKELLNALNIFDTKLYKQLLYMFDKYVVGLIFKKTEITKRVKHDDGIITAEKDFKVKQKPFGIYGNIYSYLLLDLDKFNGYMPMLAGTYVLLTDPIKLLENLGKKATDGGK